MESNFTSPSNPVGFWRRLGAGLLDAIIIGIPLILITYIITGNTEDNFITNIISSLYSLLVPVFWHGYTVGKRIVGIRIARIDGEPVGIGTMLLRDLVGGIVYIITLGIGLIVSVIMVAVRQDKRSLHDLIAGTYVTSDQP
ncbi:RDD family protein [Brevibacillus sp. HB1.3]|uniref:RDD family protein n=1 Tax=Brevibacillus sp. HB1.3 TaxID=2738842 RepID=UPI001555DA2A|nr:RDD family protein [Brevibacillus sp. HB1.3]NQF14087.1 RDD family protein [Brevibacillus sp. HB1.3]